MQKKITVIIPNYNGLKFLKPCLKALGRQSCRDFDLLVVDNGSSDGSREWLKAHQVPGIFLEENTGFSGAVNRGIKAASTPYVILLNNDTQPHPDYVKEMGIAMDRSPRIFSASSRMVQLYHKDLMDDAGDMYTLLGWPYQRGVGQSTKGYRKARRVFAACAGGAAYRREVFGQIGYFDEMHFAYLEDIDIGYRARIAGYHNIYWPRAQVFHAGSATSGSKYNPFKVRLAARNNIYLIYKNMPWPQILVNALPLALGLFIKYGFFKRMGYGGHYLEGLKEGMATARKCKKSRPKAGSIKNYVIVQGELVAGTFLYLYEFSKRKLKKKLTAI